MAKNLVIVESPAKAKTINKYLGKDYVVKASMGHVRDLPKGKLGIDVEHDFAPNYIAIKGRADVLGELKKAAKGKTVYLAPDPDREGEAIAWHLQEALGVPEERVWRVTFNEITKRAVVEALKSPGKVRANLVNAQQARRILDRLVGYKLSPLLWEKIARGLSAGRVQSVAVRLVVEREREIQAFKPEEYWRVIAKVRRPEDANLGDAAAFGAELKRKNGATLDLPNGEAAQSAFDDLQKSKFTVTTVETKRKQMKAPPPFSTSLLQQAASTQLKFAARRTMRVAQQLYEGMDVGGEDGSVGLITYMRTDSYRLAGEALNSIREWIAKKHGAQYLPEKPNFYHAKKGAQEAHEAVRPTDITRTPNKMKPHLTAEQYRLYRLIWERTIQCQMANAQFDQTSVVIDATQPQAGSPVYQLTARGRALVFDGHLKISGVMKEEGEQDLPKLTEGQSLDSLGIEKTQHFTQPPSRYSEATLVKALEKNGIGRPSTYAAILSTIQDRGYARLAERKFYATDLGEVVNDSLVKSFPEIVDVEFTAGLESKLDLIEEEKAEWVKVVRDFYDVFERDLKKASDTMESVKAMPAPGGEKCPECGKPMLLRMNRWGRFLGCSGYPECKTTQRIARDGSIEAKRPGPEPTDEICDKCGSPMVIRTGRRGRFIACSAFPKCKNSFSVDENNKPIRPIVTDISCEKCKEGKMVVRFSKRGPFLGCSRYPKCRGTQQLPKDLPEDIQEKIKARKRPAPAAESGDEAETAEPAETPAGASSDSADD